MQALIEDVKARRWRRPLILAVATISTFVLVLNIARMASEPSLELLYARLEAADASVILADLESRGVAHELRGDSVFVDASQRDRLRLDLAAEGLPGGEGAGYELLDSLSGFGTTSQMFDAALNRAREGELARTLLAGRGVSAARVHIANQARSPFSRGGGASASVTLMMKSGDVPADLAEAAQSLVAGAVGNLKVSDVSIVDARSGRIVSRNADGASGAARVERLGEMRAAVDRILGARVGPGRFVAEISLETSTEEERTRERLVDPASRVVISTDTQESTASGTEPAGQGVTVASNLPDGDAGAGGQAGESSSAETREQINYEVSETERQVTRGAGAVERITVAVMVDGSMVAGDDGQSEWTPRSEEELASITELVQSAVGFREERGDIVTVRSLRFEAPEPPGIEAVEPPWISGSQTVRLMTVAALIAAALGVMAFVVRPLLASRPSTDTSQAALAAPVPRAQAEALPPPATNPDPPDLPSIDSGGAPDLPSLSDLPDLPGLDFAGGDDEMGGASGGADPVDRLRQLISERRDETVQVLKGWIEEDAPQKEGT